MTKNARNRRFPVPPISVVDVATQLLPASGSCSGVRRHEAAERGLGSVAAARAQPARDRGGRCRRPTPTPRRRVFASGQTTVSSSRRSFIAQSHYGSMFYCSPRYKRNNGCCLFAVTVSSLFQSRCRCCFARCRLRCGIVSSHGVSLGCWSRRLQSSSWSRRTGVAYITAYFLSSSGLETFTSRQTTVSWWEAGVDAELDNQSAASIDAADRGSPADVETQGGPAAGGHRRFLRAVHAAAAGGDSPGYRRATPRGRQGLETCGFGDWSRSTADQNRRPEVTDFDTGYGQRAYYRHSGRRACCRTTCACSGWSGAVPWTSRTWTCTSLRGVTTGAHVTAGWTCTSRRSRLSFSTSTAVSTRYSTRSFPTSFGKRSPTCAAVVAPPPPSRLRLLSRGVTIIRTNNSKETFETP